MTDDASLCVECGAPMVTLGADGVQCSSLLCPTNLADLDDELASS